jgi:hypothetical protein
MVIKQLKGYNLVSAFAIIAGAILIQPFLDHRIVIAISLLVGVLSSLLIGLAFVSVLVRYLIELFRVCKSIGVKRFGLGVLATILIPIVWFLLIAKFIVVPLTLEPMTETFFFEHIGTLSVINGLYGVIYFSGIWKLKSKLLYNKNC